MPSPEDVELIRALERLQSVMARRDLTDEEETLLDLIEAYIDSLNE